MSVTTRRLPTVGAPTRRVRAVRSGALVGIACAGVLGLGVAQAPAAAQTLTGSQSGPFAETLNAQALASAFATEFWPLWYTHYQTQFLATNQLAGPRTVGPSYRAVVAINKDTLYAQAPIDMQRQPVVVTVPKTRTTFSVLTLDLYGNVTESGISTDSAGTYALVAPGWSGTLPNGVQKLEMPESFMIIIFRADRFSSTGQNQDLQARLFRRSLRLQALSDYVANPSGGAPRIVPGVFFAPGFKTIADNLANRAPITFLRQMRTAVASDKVPALTAGQQALVNAFDAVFGPDGSDLTPVERVQMSRGVRGAYRAIINRYQNNRDRNNWVHFTNIGTWGNDALDRAAITEFIQFGNSIATAAYYHTFRNRAGAALDGSRNRVHVLTFPRGRQPEANRFWSITAYTPNSIELIRNSARKYVVASYTPGLRTNPNGSVSIYMSRRKPVGVPKANWLPVSNDKFNIMLRVYGVVEGSDVANNTYVPPAVRRVNEAALRK